ncbi:putative quorum-sensing-regulated virulence factor, partial [Aquimarina pacifica]
MQLQHTFLIKLASAKMPFGKYKDRYLIDLPEYYGIKANCCVYA